MAEIKHFLDYVNELLGRELAKSRLSKVKKLDIQLSISQIFESTQDPERVFYQLLDYFEANRKLAAIKDKVEMYYMTQR